MASLAHYALPGIIVLASAGAFLMCLLVIRYGLDLRLRVAGPGTRFEVSLAGETRW